MANKLDQHYNDFGGIDSRTNVMFQNPRFARDGKNMEFKTDTASGDFDVIGKRRGAQHKSIEQYGAEVGLIEYKFKDLNTGESKTEILGVATDGKLRKRYAHKLKVSRSGGSAETYSVFYDDSVSLFKIAFYNSLGVQIGAVTFDETKTLDTLKTNLTSLSIAGLLFDIVDDNGSTVSSNLKAYLLDTVISHELVDSDDTYNSAFSWSLVSTPNSSGVLFDYVASGDWKRNSEFAGISYVNLNNSVYITDGGFPIKYDGFSAYRAGMPAFQQGSYSGWQVAVSATAGAWTAGDHAVRVQLRYRDPSGSVILGKIQPLANTVLGDRSGAFYTDGQFTFNIPVSTKKVNFTPRALINADDFPIFSCQLDSGGATPIYDSGSQTYNFSSSSSGSYTFPVKSGHNVKVGQALRVSQETSGLNTTTWYWKVTAVTLTSVTIDYVVDSTALVFQVNQVFNSCYVPDELFGRRDVSADTSGFAINVYGPYFAVFVTKANQATTGPYYQAPGFFGIPWTVSQEKQYATEILDASLTVPFDDTTESGKDLPRACKYLSAWQGQLVQAGRPYDASVANDRYPTSYSNPPNYTTNQLLLLNYTEAHLCDFQSIYWADINDVEGFSQSGLDQDSVDTKFNDQITGMAENKDAFFVFKNRGMALFSGTLATGDINKEILETDIGCGSHLSIQESQGALMWLDPTYGFCMGVAGRLPEIIGFPIQNIQKKNQFQSRLKKLRWSGARAVVHRISNKYICYIPAGTNDDDNTTEVPSPQSESLICVFDFSKTASGNRSAWYFWKDLNAAGGLLSIDDELLFSSWTGSSTEATWKMKKTGTKYDYSDHTSAIDMILKSAWINFSLQSIDKRWVQLCVTSVKRGFRLLVSQYYNYIDSKAGEIEINFQDGKTASPKMTVGLNNEKAIAMSIGFQNNRIHEDVSINGWDLQYSPDYDPGEIKK